MKAKLEATIPTMQYGNLRPVFEQEDEEYGVFYADAESHIRELWRKFGEKPLPDRDSGGEKVTSFTEEDLIYNSETHTYQDLNGNVLTSGSVYAESMMPPFDKEQILPRTAKAWGVDAEHLDEIWSLNSDVSTAYGNAIHTAIELYHKHKGMGAKIAEQKALEFNYVLPKNTHIREIVEEFDNLYGTDALVEVLVSDVANGRAGRVDRLDILDEEAKVCRVGDFKTNNDLTDKKLEKYQHQLSFYAHILMAHGWSVSGLDIYHYGTSWELTHLDILDLVDKR